MDCVNYVFADSLLLTDERSQKSISYGGVVMKRMLVFVILTFLALTGYSNAAEVEAMLSNAKRDGKVVMLELGSAGCIPCEQMKPVMEKLRADYKGKLEVFFVDVRKDKETARKFHVFAIPTQVFLDNTGKEFHRHMGFYDYEEIEPVLKKAGL
jgi:thioredoxin 1